MDAETEHSHASAALEAKGTALSRWLNLLAKLIGAGALAFGVVQYCQSRVDMRVQRSLDYAQRFEGDKFVDTRHQVDRIALAADLAAQRRQTEFADVPAEERARGWMKAETQVVYEFSESSTELPQAIIEVTGFFNSLQICIDQRLCDAAAAHALFDAYATRFWHDFEPVMTFEREHSRPGFGREMQKFVKDSGKLS